MVYSTYSEIKALRNEKLSTIALNHFQLNSFHEQLMGYVLNIALMQTTENLGAPPSAFSFFVMGSAGRFEQGIWSDQDHGIIFDEHSIEAQEYFLQLGKEISKGLHETGYKYCDGGVMASNTIWCKSLSDWKKQLSSWISECSWETIRYLLIFIDARSLYGEKEYVNHLKEFVYYSQQKGRLLISMKNNTMFFKKGVGVFGQLLVETHGTHTGTLNLKEKAFFPYVNAARLLAIKDHIYESSTLSRLEQISEINIPRLKQYKEHFEALLEIRLKFSDHADYESGHFLQTQNLSKEHKRVLKEILKFGLELHQYSCKLIEEDSYGIE